MKLPVYLEKMAGNGFRASTLTCDRFTVEAPTREEAVDSLRRLMENHLHRGDLIDLEVTDDQEKDPWLEFAGVWKDDPYFDDFVEAMKEYRKQVDSDPDRL